MELHKVCEASTGMLFLLVVLLSPQYCCTTSSPTSNTNETTASTALLSITSTTHPTPSPTSTSGNSSSTSQDSNQASPKQILGTTCASSCAVSALLTSNGSPAALQGCVNACLRATSSAIPASSAPQNYISWPEGDSAFSYLSTRTFLHFNVLLVFGSVVIAGLGSEVVVGQYIVERLDPDAAATLWVYAQVCFPIFISIGVFSQSVFGLPFLVLGMWKFGFPETLAYIVSTKQHGMDEGWLSLGALSNASNAGGLLLHHISSAYFVTCGCVGYNQLDRYSRTMMTPLVLQHWVVLVRYVNFSVYCVLALILELLWEFEVFWNARFLQPNFEVAVIFLLIAHWLFLLAYMFEQAEIFFTNRMARINQDPMPLVMDADGKVHEEEASFNNEADLRDPHKLLLKSVFKVVDAAEEARGEHGSENAKQYMYKCDNGTSEAHQAGPQVHLGGRAGGARGSIFGTRASILSAGITHHPVSYQRATVSRPAMDHVEVGGNNAVGARGKHSIFHWKTTLQGGSSSGRGRSGNHGSSRSSARNSAPSADLAL